MMPQDQKPADAKVLYTENNRSAKSHLCFCHVSLLLFCSVGDLLELVFADADLVPLLVQENYLNYRPDIAQNKPEFVSSDGCL